MGRDWNNTPDKGKPREGRSSTLLGTGESGCRAPNHSKTGFKSSTAYGTTFEEVGLLAKAPFWRLQQTLLLCGPDRAESMKHRHSRGLQQLLGIELPGAAISISEKML